MHTTYYFKSAAEINTDIVEKIKTAFKGKPVVITVEEESDKTEVKRQFEIYKEIWEQDTIVSSSTTEIIHHPAYLHIIALGKDVVPLLLKDMIETSNHWFYALYKITGADPIPKEHEGKIQQMIKDWILWANKNNIDF